MGPVRDLLGRYIRPGIKLLDPFAGYSLVGTRTNDLTRRRAHKITCRPTNGSMSWHLKGSYMI